MKKKISRNQKTFTLPEILLSAGIMVFALCAMMAGFLGTMVLAGINRNCTVAVSHAQYAMEEIKNTNFDFISNFTWNTNNIEAKGLSALDNETITAAVSGSALLNIKVTTYWKDYGQRERNVSVETLITRP